MTRQEFRVSFKRRGQYAHLRHRVFATRKAADRLMRFLSTGLGRSGVDPDGYKMYDPILVGPKLEVREVGPWQDAE